MQYHQIGLVWSALKHSTYCQTIPLRSISPKFFFSRPNKTRKRVHYKCPDICLIFNSSHRIKPSGIRVSPICRHRHSDIHKSDANPHHRLRCAKRKNPRNNPLNSPDAKSTLKFPVLSPLLTPRKSPSHFLLCFPRSASCAISTPHFI